MRRRNVKNASQRLEEATEYVILDGKKYYKRWKELFGNDNPLYIEIGMGKGDFLTTLALNNPNINYIGIEKYASVIIQAIPKIKSANLKLLCCDAKEINEIFSYKEISKVYLNFSDPWPKKRHEKRRLTHKGFLTKYHHILQNNCSIELKTDNPHLYAYSIISFNQNNWQIIDASVNLHHERSEITTTEYEKKFISLGQPIYFVEAKCNEK